MRQRVIGLYGLLIALSLLAWAWALLMSAGSSALLGTALLAYSLGLRHAVDADHIAAIDNVTRKLMQEGKRPLASGLFFSLGHSTVVVLASIAIAASAGSIGERFPALKEVGGLVGTGVSVLFLFAIATANLVVLRGVYRAFAKARRGEAMPGEAAALMLGGPLARLVRPLFALVRRSWHMYPLGFLFGLGFDTATEVGLLGIAAAEASNGLPIWSILVFPALFTAGMTLVDTTDSVVMVGAYGWAFEKPVRRLTYNLAITFVSVVVAFLVGGIEAIGLAVEKLGLAGGAWGLLGWLNDHLDIVGFLVIALCLGCWAAFAYRLKRDDAIATLRS